MQRFPDGFLWGTATAAYQIEGAVNADGRGPSIWDTFSHQPGRTHAGDTGDTACDHYHRFAEDVEIMADLGLNAYRFSVAWPRVLPDGTGAPNERGLAFYERLVDALLARNIRPFVTLYHWDLPQALEDTGGWCRRETADYFADYAALMGRRLGDRVKDWITLNEPMSCVVLGHVFGIHAPGRQDVGEAMRAAHHLNLAHGRGVRALRSTVPGARVGITHVCMPVHPASDSEADREAARRFDAFINRWYFDPTLRGSYPEEVLEALGEAAPPVRPGDLDEIAPRIDFFGHNSYTRMIVRDDPAAPLTRATPVPGPGPKTAMGWEIYPDHLRESLVRIQRDYDPPAIVITENGAAFDDRLEGDAVHDPQRVDYLRTHLQAALRAIEEGVRLRGYFCWSLLDNFEWAEGYSKRFGLVYVDYPTQRRIVKDSGRFFAEVARANALP